MANTIAERHLYILEKLKEKGYVNVLELSSELKVSAVTIRKDLKLLEERKLLFRSHGSATSQDPYITDRHVNDKEKIQVSEKQRIARAALSMIDPSDSIILASGTTINELSRQMKNMEGVTVITASLIASQNLTVNAGIELIQLGGLVRKSSSSIVGPQAESMLRGFSSNRLFLGVDGIDPEFGLTTTNSLEASLNQAMIEAARRVIVLADSTKFGRRGFGRICGLERVDTIITDKAAPEKLVAMCHEKGVEVILV